jgi:hypothetical protein
MGRYLSLSNSVCRAGAKDVMIGFDGLPVSLLVSENRMA